MYSDQCRTHISLQIHEVPVLERSSCLNDFHRNWQLRGSLNAKHLNGATVVSLGLISFLVKS